MRLTHTWREELQQQPPRPADTRGPCTRWGPVSPLLSSVRDGGAWGGFNSPFVWTEDQWGARAAQGHLPTPGLISQGQQLSQELPVAPEATISCQPPRGPTVPLLGLPESPPPEPPLLWHLSGTSPNGSQVPNGSVAWPLPGPTQELSLLLIWPHSSLEAHVSLSKRVGMCCLQNPRWLTTGITWQLGGLHTSTAGDTAWETAVLHASRHGRKTKTKFQNDSPSTAPHISSGQHKLTATHFSLWGEG